MQTKDRWVFSLVWSGVECCTDVVCEWMSVACKVTQGCVSAYAMGSNFLTCFFHVNPCSDVYIGDQLIVWLNMFNYSEYAMPGSYCKVLCPRFSSKFMRRFFFSLNTFPGEQASSLHPGSPEFKLIWPLQAHTHIPNNWNEIVFSDNKQKTWHCTATYLVISRKNCLLN